MIVMDCKVGKSKSVKMADSPYTHELEVAALKHTPQVGGVEEILGLFL